VGQQKALIDQKILIGRRPINPAAVVLRALCVTKDRFEVKTMPSQTQRIQNDEMPRGASFSFADFEYMFGRGQIDIAEESLRKSYQALDQMQKHKNLSRRTIEEKLHTLANDLQSELFKSGGQLKASSIPLTELDWEII